jgi:holo-[acyl-carrier protein] synthase
VEVVPREGRAPTLALTGRAEARARELGVERIWITLSHTDTTAAAVVILERS